MNITEFGIWIFKNSALNLSKYYISKITDILYPLGFINTLIKVYASLNLLFTTTNINYA